jgi:hypothetical protein
MTSAQSTVPGMPCPDCGARIVATMQQLLAGSISCPACHLVLKVDAAQSRETLDELRKLNARLQSLPKP